MHCLGDQWDRWSRVPEGNGKCPEPAGYQELLDSRFFVLHLFVLFYVYVGEMHAWHSASLKAGGQFDRTNHSLLPHGSWGSNSGLVTAPLLTGSSCQPVFVKSGVSVPRWPCPQEKRLILSWFLSPASVSKVTSMANVCCIFSRMGSQANVDVFIPSL